MAGTLRTIAVGGFARIDAQPNNWRYFTDIYLDTSLARVVLANHPTLSQATIVEVQIPQAWSDGSITIRSNLGKFVPGLSTIAPPLAGALQMSLLRFVALSTLGAALWVFAFMAAGAMLQRQIDALVPYLTRYAGPALLVAGVLLAGYVAFRWWERRRFHALLRMARISVDDLYALIEAAGAPVILDVRSHSARLLDPRVIPSALHVPPDEVGRHLDHLPRDREVILYCTCPNEASAANLARLLVRHGFTRVRPLQGGLDAWVAAGYPVGDAAAAGSG